MEVASPEFYVPFVSHRGKSDGIGVEVFSQWYPASFTDKTGETFSNAEQYMMAMKAKLFNDNETYRKIMSAANPAKIKELGRTVKNFKPDVWLEHRERIVYEGNILKFSQNEALRRFLLSFPKNAVFVEAAHYDRIWGIGYRAEDMFKVGKEKWGLNLLGKTLTRVRDDIRANQGTL